MSTPDETWTQNEVTEPLLVYPVSGPEVWPRTLEVGTKVRIAPPRPGHAVVTLALPDEWGTYMVTVREAAPALAEELADPVRDKMRAVR